MASLDDNVEATQVLAEDSENPETGLGGEDEANRVSVLDVQKEGDVSAAAAATEGFVGTESVLESIFDCNSSLGGTGEIGVGGFSSAGHGGGSALVSAIDAVVGRDERVDNGDGFCLNNVGSDGEKSKESGRNDSDVEEGGNGIGLWNGEKLEDGDHGYRVGDLVWGKIKSHPWWPGQIYDPRDASEFAVKHSQEGRLLVAFFGDGSCSWCLPSQVVPFVENFKKMSKDGSSKSFVNAMQRAVDEVGRLVESKMICKCVPLEKRDHLARPMATNAGVKSGILVPEVDIDRLLIPDYEPAEILGEVSKFAKFVSIDNAFELGILRSWLSAFYFAKCNYPLAVYCEPLPIEGLEDNDDNGTAVYNDFTVAIEVPIKGPQDDKIHHRRKKKSVAELMGKMDNDEPKSQQRATSGEGRVEDEGGKHVGSSTGKSGRKRRVEVSELYNITEEKVKKIESVEAKEEFAILSSPRERKQSKYLSPPYTNLSWRTVNSGSKMESESDKKLIKAPSPVSELDDETSDEDASVEKNAHAVVNDKTLTFSVSEVDVSVEEVLSEMEFAALDPFYLRQKGSLNMVWGFISALRSSTYSHGSDYRGYLKSKLVGRKRKPVPRLHTTDDLMLDVRVIRQKLDIMSAILKNHCSKFSIEEKSSLKDEMKHVMESVESASVKVFALAETASP